MDCPTCGQPVIPDPVFPGLGNIHVLTGLFVCGEWDNDQDDDDA